MRTPTLHRDQPSVVPETKRETRHRPALQSERGEMFGRWRAGVTSSARFSAGRFRWLARQWAGWCARANLTDLRNDAS